MPRDRGVVTAVEMMYVLLFGLLALAFLTFLGRLHAAGIQVASASQSAARAASQAATSADGAAAAREAVAPLARRCRSGAATAMSWAPSPQGTWQGGSVTVTVTCVVESSSLSAVWLPGTRTIRVTDTQPIDRYKR